MYIDMLWLNFCSLNFVFPLFLDMAMYMYRLYANEFEAKEKQKLTERKN